MSDTRLIMVWGTTSDDDECEAAWLENLLSRNVEHPDDMWPLILEEGNVFVNPEIDGAIDPPLRVMTADKFLAMFPKPGRLPEEGEVLMEVREPFNPDLHTLRVMLNCAEQPQDLAALKRILAAIQALPGNPSAEQIEEFRATARTIIDDEAFSPTHPAWRSLIEDLAEELE